MANIYFIVEFSVATILRAATFLEFIYFPIPLAIPTS